MVVRSGFFNSVNGDRKYDASRFAEYFASFIGNGVFPNPLDGLQVMANDDMTVTVKAGKAWINGYILINDDDYILTLEPADGVLDRIDRIVARYDTEDREIRLEVKQGTFASEPTAPALQRDADAYELALADIYVGAGVTSITDDNITDLRNDKDLCGKVDSLIAGDVISLAEALDEHKTDNTNPHQVTKEQVGLGNVQNYGIATQSEAEAGTSNTKYMTPLRVAQAIKSTTKIAFGKYTGTGSARTISTGINAKFAIINNGQLYSSNNSRFLAFVTSSYTVYSSSSSNRYEITSVKLVNGNISFENSYFNKSGDIYDWIAFE